MVSPSTFRKLLLFGVASTGLLVAAGAEEISLLATENGLAVNTSMALGDGQFLIPAPGLVETDVYAPVKAAVQVVDDKNLMLQYPNGAEIKVSVSGTRVTFAYAKIPAGTTRISMGFAINREAWQGSKFSFAEKRLEAFPEEDARNPLFEGSARLFTLVDPAGNGIAISAPDLKFTLTNKGSEGWSHFGCSMSYLLADHPGESEFWLEFRSVTAK